MYQVLFQKTSPQKKTLKIINLKRGLEEKLPVGMKKYIRV